MKSSIVVSLFALFSFTAGPAATAQAPAVPATAVSLKIDLVAWGSEIPGLMLKSGDGSTGVTALAFRYSKALAYSGPNILEISQVAEGGKKGDTAKPDLNPGETPILPAAITSGASGDAVPPAILARRKENPNLVALAVLPTNSKRVTVLLAPGPAGTFLTWVIDDDPTKLPFGQLRVHNLSPMPIALRCNGTATKELKAKASFVTAPDNQGQIVYELAYMQDEAWKMQENNLIKITADEQAQMIILKSDDQYFSSADGSRAGFLQVVDLRRSRIEPVEPTPP